MVLSLVRIASSMIQFVLQFRAKMTSKRKHHMLSIKEKIELIKSLEAGYTVTVLSEKYKVGKSKNLVKDWFDTSFVPPVRNKKQQLNLKTKELLILDNARRQPDDLCSDNKKIVVMFLSANVIHLVQPMDQNVIQTVKLHYKNVLLKRFVASEGADTSAELKKVNLKDVVIGLAKAWGNVRPELIQKSWNKLLAQSDDG